MAEKGEKQREAGSSRSSDANSAVGGILVFVGLMLVFFGYSMGAYVDLGFAVMILGLTFVLYDILRVLREIRDK